MATPIVVLAGQSNAARLSDHIEHALNATYGPGEYILVRSYAAGAPLTRAKDGKQDWNDADELQQQMTQSTVDALKSHPESYVASVVWVQGEADTYALGAADTYGQAFSSLLSDYRQTVAQTMGTGTTGVEDAVAVISMLSSDAPAASTRPNWNLIQTQQKDLAASDPNIKIVNPDVLANALSVPQTEMFWDDLHYSENFARSLAEDLVDATQDGSTGQSFYNRGTVDNDVFVPARGPCVMAGGLGDDTYTITARIQRIVELEDEGVDTVYADFSFGLRLHSQNLENLVLSGDLNINGTGNGQANEIRGNAGDNILNGAWGNDTLIGGAGNDTFRDQFGADHMDGGSGNDVYYVDHRNDVIVERAGQGHDVVNSKVSLALRTFGHEIEDLKLMGTADLNGTGNGADNLVRGNQGDNTLYGAWGNDLLVGAAGKDLLGGGQGADRLVGGADADTFQFIGDWGQDVVDDFDTTQSGEVLDLRLQNEIHSFDDLIADHATQKGRSVLIEDGTGNSITLRGVDLVDLQADDFLF